MRRLNICTCKTVLLHLFLLSICHSAIAQTVIDMSGREVTIPNKVERILLGEGRLLQAIALLEGDQPFARIVGWQGDFKKLDPQSYASYRTKFPEIEAIPLIGDTTADSISAEKVLTLNPDVAILGLSGHGPNLESELVKQLEKAGVPVVFIDFRNKPTQNTLPSLRLLGQVLHREHIAERYIAFYEANLKKVTDVVGGIKEKDKVSVFIELKAGTSDACCTTAGNGNMGDMIELAGGLNIAKNLLSSALGTINLEKVIASNPDIYIASGGITSGKGQSGIPFGMQTSQSQAQAGLASVLDRKGIATLAAVENKRVYGVWHNYYNSPYNILAIQNFAKWFYPEQFKDLDPQQTLVELHREFLAIDPTGTFWVELE